MPGEGSGRPAGHTTTINGVQQFKRKYSTQILVLTVDATPPAVRHGQQHVTKPAHEGEQTDGQRPSANQSEKQLRTQRRAAVQALKKAVLEAKLPHGLLLLRWHAESHGLQGRKRGLVGKKGLNADRKTQGSAPTAIMTKTNMNKK
jgi:hypothetical protein